MAIDMGQSVKDLGNSLIGNTASAILKVYDYRSAQPRGDNTQGLAAMAAALSSQVVEGVDGQKAEEKIFHVQFNPSELSMFASAKREEAGSAEEEPGKPAMTYTEAIEKPKVYLTVNLIFDHVVNQDAFASDRYLATPSGVAGSIMAADSLVKQSQGKKARVHSVQMEVEGMIAAIHNRFTRLISFQWGDFSFTGALEDVQAQYTMFSLSGRPIRAKVTLKLIQTDDSMRQDNWRRDFNQAFKDKVFN